MPRWADDVRTGEMKGYVKNTLEYDDTTRTLAGGGNYVTYPNNKSHLINKAVYSSISTLDYNGIYREKYIEFDAKETKSKTSFALIVIVSLYVT